jgi:rhodanese-related sulfurtransferase
MLVTATLRELDAAQAAAHVDEGAAWVDLRSTDDYLDVHIPGSLSLVFEWGPGMATRARDCLPLSLPVVILQTPGVDTLHAANSLRGKGFTVLGTVHDGINAWAERNGTPASTDVYDRDDAPSGTIIDVHDPGVQRVDGALDIPADRLWRRIDEVPDDKRAVVVGGYGVRAGLAVGILERAGLPEVAFWRHRKRR